MYVHLRCRRKSISGEVTIRNAETGEFVATAGSALSPDLVVAKQLFDQCGGLLDILVY